MKRVFKCFRTTLLLLILFFIIEIIISAKGLTVSHFTIESSKVTDSFRVVQISDLHNATFGYRNSRLAKKIKKQSPDLIFITGDLLNSHQKEYSNVSKMIQRLSEICPVYISLGNQDLDYEQKYGLDVKKMFEEAGGSVLEFSYKDLMVGDTQIRLGGLYGYCVWAQGEENPEEEQFLSEFQQTDRLKLLLCHMPECWYTRINYQDTDCVFCGHVHGGQVILPFIGGLYAPDDGFFPGKVWGLFESISGKPERSETKKMILTRGLGSSAELLPRFWNIPEIVVVDFVSF